MPDCTGLNAINPLCQAAKGVSSVLYGQLESFANGVTEMFGKFVASLGSMWVYIKTPDLAGTGGSSPVPAGAAPANAGNLVAVLDGVMWLSLAIAVLSLIALGARLAVSMRAGEGLATVGRVSWILGGVILSSASGAVVTRLVPTNPNGSAGAVLFLQSSLTWVTVSVAIGATIIGGAQMAWHQRAEPGRNWLSAMLTLVVVAGAGTFFVSMLTKTADSTAAWLLQGALSCDITDPAGSCFGRQMMTLLGLSTVVPLGPLTVIFMGTTAIWASFFQVALMVLRLGLLVIMTGTLPLSASFANTEMGRTWFKRHVAWLLAFILYKPAAAVVYAAAFQLAGTNAFAGDSTGLVAIIAGLALMGLALIMLPALMVMVSPMANLGGGGGGAGAGAGLLAALPTGAAAVGRLAGSGFGGRSSQGPSGSGGGQGSSGSGGGQGSPGGGGGQGPSGSSATGPSGSAGAAPAAGGAAPATAGAAAGGSGGAAASGAAAGGAAAGGAGAGGAAAAGAAGGPVGIAAGAAIGVASKAADGAKQAAQNLGQQATGDGSKS